VTQNWLGTCSRAVAAGGTRNQRRLRRASGAIRAHRTSEHMRVHHQAHQGTVEHGRAPSNHGRRGNAESNDISAWSWAGTVGIVPRWCSIGVGGGLVDGSVGSVPYGSVELPDGPPCQGGRSASASAGRRPLSRQRGQGEGRAEAALKGHWHSADCARGRSWGRDCDATGRKGKQSARYVTAPP
jgi:hypothetical protein